MKKGRKFSEGVENSVGKGEIAHHNQFLLFPLCFQILVQETRKNKGLFGKGLMSFLQGRSNSGLCDKGLY